MVKESLNGLWKLSWEGMTCEEISGTVPGSVYSFLLGAGLMDDPFYRDNELKALQLMERDYVFTKVFDVPEGIALSRHQVLRFDGIDTIADVCLNDVLLGKQNVSNVSWQALNERFKTAELFGKLANIFADLPTKNIDDNGIFKALVGEDYLTVEKKNRNPFSFQSSARLLFSCNSIPKNYGDRSEGFYRRLIIIRFNHSVPQDKRDPLLLDKFRMEADGIFQFALEGLLRLMNNHYVFSETQINADELQQYREESDSVLSFVKDYCELDDGYSAGSTELFNAYKAYCEECGLKPYSQKSFVQQITAAFPGVMRDIDRMAKRRILTGIRLGEVLG